MKQIPLTKGQVALVDDDDFDRLNQIKWHAQKDGHSYYACHAWRDGKKLGLTYMQKVVIDCPPGMQIDHINGNRLDNRKNNLRVCTAVQNSWNKKARNNKSGYKGVKWTNNPPQRRKRWSACICVFGKTISLGIHLTAKDAAMAYNEAAKKHFGEFARLNKID